MKNYKIVINSELEGYSEYNNKLINRYRPNSELKQGINLYVKNVKTNRIINLKFNENVMFSQDRCEFIAINRGIKV